MKRRVYVDLTGSNAGPDFLSVTIRGRWPEEWDDDRLRAEAARYYAVPVEQTRVLRSRRIALSEDQS